MINKKIENCSIVIAGFWNSKIFTPQWISNGRLTNSEKIQIEVAVDNPDLPMRIMFDDIFLRISDRRLILNPSNDETTQFEKIENVAIKILEDLPHTPIKAVGVNFQYINKEPNEKDSNIFNIYDNDLLSDFGIEIKATTIKRTIFKDEQLINLEITFDEDNNIVYSFNFHRDLKDTKKAIEYLRENVVKFNEEAENILNKIYKQETEEEAENV